MFPSRHSEDFKFFLDPWKWLITKVFSKALDFPEDFADGYWEQHSAKGLQVVRIHLQSLNQKLKNGNRGG